jgi:hypothetical protein
MNQMICLSIQKKHALVTPAACVPALSDAGQVLKIQNQALPIQL